MARNNRKEAAKKLTEMIKECTDPAVAANLAEQLNKMLGKSQRQLPKRKAAKPLEEPRKVGKHPRPKTGSAVDLLSDEEYEIHSIVVRAEEIIREAKRQGLPVPTTRQAIEQAESALGAS